MTPKRIDSYEAGYSVSGAVKKAVVATAAATAMLGGLTGCFHNSISGNMEYRPPEYDGYMVVENVSDSDVSPSDSCSSDDESFTLDGDVSYFSDTSH